MISRLQPTAFPGRVSHVFMVATGDHKETLHSLWLWCRPAGQGAQRDISRHGARVGPLVLAAGVAGVQGRGGAGRRHPPAAGNVQPSGAWHGACSLTCTALSE